jgi:translation initiation factor 4G
LPKTKPGCLDLLSAPKGNIPAGLPSALTTDCIINDLGVIPCPEGIMSLKLELNVNAKDGKFRYIV